MALEKISDSFWRLEPGPFDVHTHPRVFDAITPDGFLAINNGQEGKAGLKVYTEAALRAGIVGMLAMPNESVRLIDKSEIGESESERTITRPYPIASLDRVTPMQAAISHEAVIPTGVYMGLDPATAFRDQAKARLHSSLLQREFTNVQDECLALKVYLAETTGGNNIALQHAAEVTRIWHRTNPEKPIVFHVEGRDVLQLLHDIDKLPGGKDIPVHIAHVSSHEELEAVIAAKRVAMNVTCEVTPHHLFLDESAREELGGYGCVKPSLKPKEDRAFLWANMEYIDIFASDCAPHRRSDKEGEHPAFGITNHTWMLPLLMGAVQEGRLTMEDIYQKFCLAPRQRFNLPPNDSSFITVDPLSNKELIENELYSQSPFSRLPEQRTQLLGGVLYAEVGASAYTGHELKASASYTNLIRPKNLRSETAYNE